MCNEHVFGTIYVHTTFYSMSNWLITESIFSRKTLRNNFNELNFESKCYSLTLRQKVTFSWPLMLYDRTAVHSIPRYLHQFSLRMTRRRFYLECFVTKTFFFCWNCWPNQKMNLSYGFFFKSLHVNLLTWKDNPLREHVRSVEWIKIVSLSVLHWNGLADKKKLNILMSPLHSVLLQFFFWFFKTIDSYTLTDRAKWGRKIWWL